MKRMLLLIGSCLFLSFCSIAQSEDIEFATADSMVNAGEYQKAIKLFDVLFIRYGDKERFLTGRGFAYSQTNQLDKSKKDYTKALALNPSCSKCLLNLSQFDVMERNVAGAFSKIDQYIKLEPKDGVGYAKRGELEYYTSQFDKAITDFNKAIQLDYRSFYVYLYLAMTQMAKGNNNEAIIAVNECIKLEPEAEMALFLRGKIYIEMDEYKKACDDIFFCLRKSPNVGEYHAYAGVALYKMNEYDKAMQAINESIKLDSNIYISYQYRSYLLYSQAAFTKACKDKEKAYSLAYAMQNEGVMDQIKKEFDEYCDLSKPSGHYHSGRVLFGQGDFSRAELAYNNALRQFPDDPLILEGRGNTAIALGKFNDAIGYYHKCITNLGKLNTKLLTDATDPIAVNASKDLFLAQLYNSLSYAHVNLVHIDSSVAWISKAIGILQKNDAAPNRNEMLSDFLVKRASMLRIQGKTDAANADLAEALKVDPQNSNAYIERAQSLILKNTYDGNAKKENLGVISQPNGPGKTNKIKYATTPLNNWDPKEIEAVLEDCNKAIAADPNNPEAYILRAQAKILLKKGDHCPDILQAKKLGIADAAERFDVKCN